MIRSLLDTDLYKLTMMQVVFEKYTNVNVRYDFKCRSGNILEKVAHPSVFYYELQMEINELCWLRFTKEDLDYLRSIRFFKPNFIEYLRLFQLNRDYVKIEAVKDLVIEINGPWISTIMFEVPILAIVSELYHRHCNDVRPEVYVESLSRITKKINHLKENLSVEELDKLRIVDLGTRRRFSFENQEMILDIMIKNKCLAATSNIFFAKKFNISYAGTMAHEYICAHQQIGRVEDCQKSAFQAWADVYRGDLGIALSDTVGFKAFLNDFDLYFAKLFDGARHDSGDPYDWCDKLIRHYESLKIDSKTKTAVFSDGLNFERIVKLFQRFNYRIRCSFGIGTNLTNDVGAKPLQIVMKMTECNGRPVSKVSDTPGKEMCLDPNFEKYVKRIFYERKQYVRHKLK